MKKILSMSLAACTLAAILAASVGCGGNTPPGNEVDAKDEWRVMSPDEKLKVDIYLGRDGSLSYSVSEEDTTVVENSSLGFMLEEDDLAQMLTFVSKTESSNSGSYQNMTGRNSTVPYSYKEITLTFSGTLYYLDITMRAYDDGYAFRYGIRGMNDAADDTVTVLSEETEFALPQDSLTWVQVYRSNTPSGNFFSYEDPYVRRKSDNLSNRTISMPMLYRAGESQVYSLVTESALIGSGYYGSFLQEDTENAGTGILRTVHTPAGAAQNDNAIGVPFRSPWRVGAVGSLEEVNESEIVEKVYDDAEYWKPDNYDSLSDEEKETYTYDWVEPGVVAWNWLANLDTPQSNWDMHYEYVDLAARMGWKYVILDGGWDETASKVRAFTQYAAEKGVKVIVWCDAYEKFNYGTSTQMLARQLETWKSWGIAGIKIDFFDGQTQAGKLTHQGEDIETIKWYESIYQGCAKQEMVVIVHGCNKPTGERRIYPNVISREAIYGNELWPASGDITVNSMFVRSVVGPTDFTPLVIPQKTNLTMGHQMALAVLYECGAPCMADLAENYTDDVKEFYSSVPSSRDETVFLCGEPDGYYCAAVRAGDTWFVAGINASGESRTAEIDFSFLSDGEYSATFYVDEGDSGAAVAKSTKTLAASSSERMEMTANGGFVVQITKK